MTLTAVGHSFQVSFFSLYGPTEINVIMCSDVPELQHVEWCNTYMHCRQVGIEHFMRVLLSVN